MSTKKQEPTLHRVLLLNDDYTTMEFVIHVLESVFTKSPAEAYQIMMQVHTNGRGLAGIYPWEVAETKAEVPALSEACRPVHFYERDASPVLPERHPDWVVWAGRTHWHPEISKDRLGKPVAEPQFESHGWTGKDRQHWSSNLLGGFALLTAAPWARLAPRVHAIPTAICT